MRKYLLFEVGGTNTKIGFSDGKKLQNIEVIPSRDNFENFLGELKEKLPSGIEAICGGMPLVFGQDGVPIASAHMPSWVGIDVKKRLDEAFGIPVFLENDTALGALGEAIRGAGAGFPIVGFIAIGTGVGGARVVGGKIDRKSLGFEPGHQIIVPDGEECSCKGKGHLEAYIAGSYLEKKYHQRGEFIKEKAVWAEIARFLAIGLYNSSVHWSPDIFVLGGLVSQSIPLDLVIKNLREFSTIFPKIPEVRLQSLGKEAGLYGAQEYLMKNQ